MPKNKKARIEREDLTIVTMPRDLLIQIASRFIVTQFKRPLAGKELRNLALTCKALYKLLFVDDAYILGLAQAKHIQQRLLAPVPAPLEIDTYKNVSWRVSFETDLCVLVLYRAEIIGPAVRRVALWAAGYLNSNRKKGEVASKTALGPNRFFGSLQAVDPDTVTVDTAIAILQNTDRIETMMVLLQMIHDHVVMKTHGGHLPGVPELSAFRTSNFENDRKQIKKLSEGKAAPKSRRLGITATSIECGDIPEHSFALGRVMRSGSRDGGFGKRQDEEKLPFVGGPSGSAISLIRIAIAAGLLDNVEHTRQYLLAVIVYLVGGGQHSIAEVMHGLAPQLHTIKYQRGSYTQLLPQSLTETYEWKRIRFKYDAYIKDL